MEEKKPFITEKIRKKTGAGKLFRRIIGIIAGAILFGVVAAVAAVLSKPAAESYLIPPETTPQQMVVIPRDDPAVVSRVEPEIPETEKEEDTPVEEIVDKALEEREYSVQDLEGIWDSFRKVCDEADRSVVNVKAIDSGTDWFDNELSREGNYSGVIISSNSTSMMVLTVKEATEREAMKIELLDGTQVEGKVHRIDEPSGLAIVKFSKSGLNEEQLEKYRPLDLGNSYLVERGDILAVMGSPIGMIHSLVNTTSVLVSKNIPVTDGSIHCIYLKDRCDGRNGSWVINTSGQLVGWIDPQGSRDEDPVRAIAISDYKPQIERMINSLEYAYIGIVPADISEDMLSAGIPSGVYVKEVLPGSPAYEAGIQPGDIISDVDKKMVLSVAGYQAVLEGLKTGSETEVSVKREGADGYKEITYELLVGNR